MSWHPIIHSQAMSTRCHAAYHFGAGRGFTLVELLIVISVIAALMAMMLPAISGYRERAAVRQNQALISSVVGAMNSFGVDTFTDPAPGDGQPSVYRAWYTLGDGLLDGDPRKDGWPEDPEMQEVYDRLLVGDEMEYAGPAQMLPIIIPKRHIDARTGHIVDSWGNPLRVLDPTNDKDPYTQDLADQVIGIGLWSSGPSGDPMNKSDNIVSWSSEGVN